MSVIGPPPTNGVSGAAVTPVTPPLPSGPWQAAHFSAKMRPPWAGVPPPSGKPLPSGSMLMSQAAISASFSGLPRPGPSASAGPAIRQSASPRAGTIELCVDMLDLPRTLDPPAGDRVEVMVQHRPDRRRRLQLPARGDEFGPGRLRVARVVPGAALQHRRAAVPTPRHAKARERLAQYRLRQGRLAPALAAVGRNHDLGDPAGPGIGDAGDLPEPRPLQAQPGRGAGDERLDLLQQVELVGLAVRQQRGIGPSLPVAHGRPLDELNAPQVLDV